MQEIIQLLSNPLVWKLVGGYWIFNAATSSLPQATEKSAAWYQFAFRFMHALGGNLDRAARKFNVPGAEPQP
jgi:hypothetical protein